MKKAKKAVKSGEKKAKQPKQRKITPNRDFLTNGAQNFYLTDKSIVTQKILSIDKSGKPVMVKNEYYARTKAREKALAEAGVKPGKPVKGTAKVRQTTFSR